MFKAIKILAGMLATISGVGLVASLRAETPSTPAATAANGAPAPWPRYKATMAKDRVNLRVEPSLKGRLAPDKASKGTVLSVQRAADPKWLEILEPDEFRGFFVREDMLTIGEKE